MKMITRPPILTQFERERIKEVKALIDQGIPPLTVSISSGNGAYKIGFDDLANYVRYYRMPYLITISAFQLIGDEKRVKRQTILP